MTDKSTVGMSVTDVANEIKRKNIALLESCAKYDSGKNMSDQLIIHDSGSYKYDTKFLFSDITIVSTEYYEEYRDLSIGRFVISIKSSSCVPPSKIINDALYKIKVREVNQEGDIGKYYAREVTGITKLDDFLRNLNDTGTILKSNSQCCIVL